MKTWRKLLLIVLGLMPACLWLINAGTHRLASLPLEGDRDVYQHIRRVCEASYPFLTKELLHLVSVTDPYIYEFDVSESPSLSKRYEIGGKGKVILEQENSLILGYQENGLMNRLIQIVRFDRNRGIVEPLTEKQLVTGEMVHNLMVFEGQIYAWYIKEGAVILLTTDGTAIHETRLPVTVDPDRDRIGFNLDVPLVANRPVLVIDSGAELLRFKVRPDASLVQLSAQSNGIVDDVKLKALADSGKYGRIYLSDQAVYARQDSQDQAQEDLLSDWLPDKLILENADPLADGSEPKDFTTDVFALPDFRPQSSVQSRSYLYPGYLLGQTGADLLSQEAAELLQEKTVLYYQSKLDETDARLGDFLANDQFMSYVGSRSSLGLILLQLVLGWAVWGVLKSDEEGTA